MTHKTDHQKTADMLFSLQNMLFELHEEAQELRQKHAMSSIFKSVPPINSLALALQSAGEIRRVLRSLVPYEKADTKPATSSGKGGDV